MTSVSLGSLFYCIQFKKLKRDTAITYHTLRPNLFFITIFMLKEKY